MSLQLHDSSFQYGLEVVCVCDVGLDLYLMSFFAASLERERSGSVVECLTRDRRAVGSSLTSVTALCP